MHPLIWGALALLIFSKKGTTSTASPQLLAAQTALQKAQAQIAQQAALAKAQAAAQSKPSGGGSGGGSALGAATPIGSSALSNQLSQFLANLNGGTSKPGTEQTVPVSTDLGTIDSASGPGDFTIGTDPLQQVLQQSAAVAELDGETPGVTTDYSVDSGLTDLIPSPVSTDSSATDYQPPTVDPFATDPSSLDNSLGTSADTIDLSTVYDPNGYMGDGTFIDPSLGDASGYQGWDYGEG